jgi:histone-lysine N-methyltransferase SETMAR
MLCIWWDVEGIIHYQLLERNLTVATEHYCQQLRRLEEEIQQKRPGRLHAVIFQHDNARPHTASMTKAAIQEVDWEILPHRPTLRTLPHRITISSALSLQSARVSFDNDAELQNWLDVFFTDKQADLFKRGIENLAERWQW